ncbi:Fic family protein [Kitasatospora sp. NPDC001539]|uniref:Fic family protein n=1 Tax=Kitasatospora sp. NPDC001539 TaxID=3154384 RepID=UPI00332ED4B3
MAKPRGQRGQWTGDPRPRRRSGGLPLLRRRRGPRPRRRPAHRTGTGAGRRGTWCRARLRAAARLEQHVLGTPEPPPLRARPAFAKDDEERYGIGPDTRTRLDACLAQAADSRLSLAARAARSYLDVCFFHPFDDGNTRAALLTLLFVLARAGVTLDSVVLIRRFSHRADDPQDALSLCRSVELHLRQNRTAAR